MIKQKLIPFFLMFMLVLSFRAKGNQCPSTYPEDWVVNLNTNHNQNDLEAITYIYCAKGDSYGSTYSYYLGKTNSKHFISKTDIYGCHAWIQILIDVPNPHSLMLASSSYQAINVYYTLKSTSNFSLIQMSSVNGAFERAYTIDTVYQDSNQLCASNRTHSSLFCIGKQISNGKMTIIRFDAKSLDIQVVYYPSTYSSDKNLDLIEMHYERVFFYAREGTLNHLIDASNDNANEFTENSHHTINCDSETNLMKVTESANTTYHAIECQNKLIYFEKALKNRNLSSMYSLSTTQNFNNFGISYFNSSIYILLEEDIRYFILFINTTSQTVTKFFQHEINSLFKFNLFESSETQKIGITRNRLNVSVSNLVYAQMYLNQSHNLYLSSSTNDTSVFSLSETNSSEHNLLINKTKTYSSVPINHTLSHQPLQNSINKTHKPSNEHFGRNLESHYYTHSLGNLHYGSFEQDNFTLNITDYPCSLDLYTDNNYSNYSYNVPLYFLGKNSPIYIDYYRTVLIQNIDRSNCRLNLKFSNVSSDICYEFSLVTTDNNDYFYTNYSFCTESTFKQRVNMEFFGINISKLNLKITLGLTTGISFTGKLIFRSSDKNEWGLIHVSQQMLLLPLIAHVMKEQVEEYIISNAFATLSIYIIEEEWIDHIPQISKLHYATGTFFRDCNWHSGSTIVTNIPVILMTLFLIIINVIVFIIHQRIKHKNNKCSACTSKILLSFKFSIYIRFFFELYTFILLMSLREFVVYLFNIKSVPKDSGIHISMLFNHIILILLALFLILTLLSWVWNLKTTVIDEKCLTREFYAGILKVPENTESGDQYNHKNSSCKARIPSKIKMARLYPFILLLKRTYMIILLYVFHVYLQSYRVIVFIVLQFFHLVYMYFIRSFEHMTDQMIEITSEIMFFIFLVLLTQYKEESQWSSVPAYIFIGTILSFSLILCVVYTYRMLKNLIKTCQKLKKSNRIHNMNEDENQSQACKDNISEEAKFESWTDLSNPQPCSNSLTLDIDQHIFPVCLSQQHETFERMNVTQIQTSN